MEFLSRIGAVDALRPTFFELVDEETLIGMVKPALKTVLSVYAPRYPAYLLPAYNRFEELYALVTLAIEKYYLDTCGTVALVCTLVCGLTGRGGRWLVWR